MLPYVAAALIQLVLAAASTALAWYGISALRIVARIEGNSALTSSPSLVFWGVVLLGVAFAVLCLARLWTVYRAWQAHYSKKPLHSN